MTTYISQGVADYYGVQPGEVVDNSITNSNSSSSGGGGGSGGGSGTTTETVANGVVVRDANGNIIRDTRAIINETTKAQTEAALTGNATQTPAQQITQSQQNIQAANMLLPSLYAQAEGRAPLEPGQTYQSVVKQIGILEGARRLESGYSGVSETYGYNPEGANRYYAYRAAEAAQVNPILAEQYASGKVFVGGTPATYNDLATQGTQLDVKPSYQKTYAGITLDYLRTEATRADRAYIMAATGALGDMGYYETAREDKAPVGRLGKASYTNLTENAIAQAKSTGTATVGGLTLKMKPPPTQPNVIYEYTAELLPGLTNEEVEAAKAGLIPSNAPAKDLTGYKPKNVGTITAIGRVDNKAVVKETKPYDIYIKETPIAPQNEAVNIKSIYRTPENKYSDVDRRVYAGGAFAEGGQAYLENVNVLGIKPLGDTMNLSNQVSKALQDYADTQAHNPYIPYYLNPVWLSSEVVAGAAALPAAIGGLPGFAGKTLSAGYGVGAYTTYFLTDTATGNVNIAYPDKPTRSFMGIDWYKPEITPKDMGAEQANVIGLRARGAATDYYSTLTEPAFYAQTAGMVAMAPVFKATYETARNTIGVPEIGITVLKSEPVIKDVSKLNERGTAVEYIYAVEKEPGALKAGGKLAPGTVIKTAEGYFTIKEGNLPIDQRLTYSPTKPTGSAYGGLFYVRGANATPLIGVVEEGGFKPAVGRPTFTQPPDLAYSAAKDIGGLRAEPKAQAIAEKSIADYSTAQGLPNQPLIYEAYKYAAKQAYGYPFEAKSTLKEVLDMNKDQFGRVIYEFMKQDKDITGVKLSEVKGSVGQAIRMGTEEFRGGDVAPQDIDIRRVNAPQGAKALMEFPAAKSYFEKTGMKIQLVEKEGGSALDFYNPETKTWYHRVEFKEKGGAGAPADTGYKPVKYGTFTNPKYVGFGLEEQPFTKIDEGFYTIQLPEQLARKASAGVEPQRTGEYKGVKGRSIYKKGEAPVFYKDIADATSIAKFVSVEKARPDIYQRIADVIPLMDKEQQAATLAFLPEERAAILKAGGRVATPENPIKATTDINGKTTFSGGITAEAPKPKETKAAPASAPAPKTFDFNVYRAPRPKEAPGLGSQATDYGVSAGATGGYDMMGIKTEVKAYGKAPKPYESPKPYSSGYDYGAAPYKTPGYKAPSSPSGYNIASPKASPNYTAPAPGYKAPSSPYRAPASPSNYGTPSPNYQAPYAEPKPYKAPASPSNYKMPNYKAPYKAPAPHQAPKFYATRQPPPPPITFPTLKPSGGVEMRADMEPQTTGIKGGKHSLLADLISVEISRARYGVASSVNPKADKGIWKYEANTFGYVPTAQLIKGGGNKGRNPMPARVLIPKRKGG